MVSFRNALEYALAQEEIARDNYLSWSKKTNYKDAQNLFRNLSGMEQKHAEAIKRILAGGSSSFKLDNFEIIDMSSGLSPHPTSGMEYLEKIINYAISLEDYSMRNYASIASKVDDESVKTLFLSLSGEEKYHKTLLTQQYNRILKAH